MENVKLSPPWITFVHEVEAMFKHDPEVKVKYDSETNQIKLYVADTDKADALEKLIPESKTFGNITVHITVIPPNLEEMTKEELFKKAFAGNPALSFTSSFDTPFGHVTYIVFKNEVIQFFNDQMNDINGNKTTLLQDIAPEVFGTEHAVYYCTDAPMELSKPLGEWP